MARRPARLTSSRLVPGGGLAGHEGTAVYRGHTLLKHVGKTSEQLAERLATDPNLTWSSSFTDRGTAEAAISDALSQHSQRAAIWIGSNSHTWIIDADVGWEIGRSVHRSGMMVTSTRLQVVLRRESSVLGYHIKTAFPTP
jgi:hypothetical protein